MFLSAQLVIVVVPSLMHFSIIWCSSSLSVRKSLSLEKLGEVVSSHLILRLLGIFLLFLRRWKLFFFFSSDLVALR